MNKRLVIVLFVIIPTLSVAVFAQTNAPGDAIETMSSGQINWTVGEVTATGIGAPPSLPVNAAQARAMAERAAFVVALRNLLETVKGVRVDSETVVENFMVQSDVIKTRVSGIVRGARVLKTRYLADGSVEVLVGMSMKGALLDTIIPETFGGPSFGETPLKITPVPQRPPVLKPAPVPPQPAKPQTPSPAPVKPAEPPKLSVPEKKPEPITPTPLPEAASTISFKGGKATGIVIDGRGLGLRPALLPRIVDTQGQEIYVGQVVTRTNAVEQGVAGYAKDVNAAANNFRVTDNPAIIKGLRASGAGKTDIVVGMADAQTLRRLSSKGDFLQYCRVIIVY
jgi:hypothetical protein